MPRESESARRVYGGIWAVLAGLFRVPKEPPGLVAMGAESIESFRPAPGFLDYLKFQFWIFLLLIDGALAVLWLVILVNSPLAAILLAPVFLVVMVVPDLVAYVALHLRYDTTWYVMSGRSLRIRRGIWVIRETTITFENVQNVELKQGPLQRHFGIADLIVQTAGGSGAKPPQGQTNPHVGRIEGIDDPKRIRDVIMSRVRRSRQAGLGDERTDELPAGRDPRWTPVHLEALRAIRDQIVALRRGEGLDNNPS
jgi:membrane protein YdbS with pleckstrin-like domain